MDPETQEYRVYVLEDDYRNATTRDHRSNPPPSRSHSAPAPRSSSSPRPIGTQIVKVPVSRPHSEPYGYPYAYPPGYPYAYARPLPIDEHRISWEQIGEVIYIGAESLAALWPAPEAPPPTTGEPKIDLHNQNEHRQALAGHQVTTARIRAVGNVARSVVRLLANRVP